jgi:hypothetical protein
MSDYPEHDAFIAVEDEAGHVSDFIEWWTTAADVPRDDKGKRIPLWHLSDRNKARVIADYFGIDEEVFQAEKDAMVREMAAQQRKGSKHDDAHQP